MRTEILKRLEQIPGNISFFYENLVTGEVIGYKEQEPLMAASVIKLFIMTAVFERLEREEISKECISKEEVSKKEVSKEAVRNIDISRWDNSKGNTSESDIKNEDNGKKNISREGTLGAGVSGAGISKAEIGKAEIGNESFSAEKVFSIRREDCVPSCGALTYLHDGIQVTVMDLVTLMIIFSDNTATNVLIELLGIEEINATIKKLGFEKTILRRKMFDLEKSRNGIQNYIAAGEVGRLLKMMYEGNLISRKASEKMISIMKNQQLASKIPFYLKAIPDGPEIAHKTGEDRGITHDVGIIYGKKPFVVCFCGNETDTPQFERLMADISLELYQELNGENTRISES